MHLSLLSRSKTLHHPKGNPAPIRQSFPTSVPLSTWQPPGCFKNIAASSLTSIRSGVSVPFSWMWVGWWLIWPIEYRSDAMSPLRLGHKMARSLCFATEATIALGALSCTYVVRPPGWRITWLSPARFLTRKTMTYTKRFFQPLSIGVVCYITIDSWNACHEGFLCSQSQEQGLSQLIWIL